MVAAGLLQTPAAAQGRTAAYDRPAGDLGEALIDLARTAGEQIIVTPGLVAGRHAPPLRGRYSPQEALSRLLAGSGLQAFRSAEGVLVIRRARIAAEATTPEPAQREPLATTLSDVVVTAQKRPQRLREVPISIGVITPRDLRSAHAIDLEEVARLTPGVAIQSESPANATFVIRGVSQDSGDATREPRVSIFHDGASVSRARGAYTELFDLERVEIVRGPQSTLFGRSSMIGAINIIQAKADASGVDWRVTGELGGAGLRVAEAMVNLPLSGTTALRISGRSNRRDGYVENRLGGPDLGSVHTDALRAVASWRGDGGARADAILGFERNRPTSAPYLSRRFAPTEPRTGAVLAPVGSDVAAVANEPFRSDGVGLRRDISSLIGLLEIPLGPRATLHLTSAARRFKADETYDLDGFSAPILRFGEVAAARSQSHELRLNWSGGDRFDAVLGAAYFTETARQQTTAAEDERYLAALLAGGISAPNPQPAGELEDRAFLVRQLTSLATAAGVSLAPTVADGVAAALKAPNLERNTNFSDNTAADLYADLTVRPWDRVEVAAGVRYTYDHKRSGISAENLNGGSVLGTFRAALGAAPATRDAWLAGLAGSTAPAPPAFGFRYRPTPGDGAPIWESEDGGGLSWRATARYELRDRLNLYGSYARGRRPVVLVAGAPTTPLAPARFARVPAETIDSYEVGAKGTFAEGTLDLEAAAYFYRYRDFQTTFLVSGALQTINAGRADAPGVELQAQWRPSPGVEAFATYAFNRARFRNGALKDNRFRLAADHTAGVGVRIQRALAGGLLEVAPTLSWQSRVFFDNDNDLPGPQATFLVPDILQDETQRPFALVNLRVAYTPPGGRMELYAFASNLLGQRYLKDAGNIGDPYGAPTFVPGPGRRIGLGMTWRR